MVTEPRVSTPLVSVIMNAWNSDAFLSEAIGSVLSQTYPNWEVVLWDNASVDHTRAIAESYEDDRIHYYFDPEKVSLYRSRMNAVAKANGEFLAFLDCDDVWDPVKLEAQLAVFDDPDCVVSDTDFVIRYELAGKFRGRTRVHRVKPLGSGEGCVELLSRYGIGMSSLIFRTSLARRLWPSPPPEYSYIEDFDMVARVVTQGNLVHVSTPLMTYRLHSNNFGHQVETARQEFADWFENAGALGFSVHEIAELRRTFDRRMQIGEARVALQTGNRREFRRAIKDLPISPTVIKLWCGSLLPSSLFRRLART